MKKFPVPYKFLCGRTDLSWSDVYWGFKAGWLEPSGVVDFAVDQIASPGYSQLEVELAGLLPCELYEVPFILEKMRDSGELSEESSGDPKRKWLILLLHWFYEHRADLPDPLGIVEEVYAEFDYPDEMDGIVRYMQFEGGPKSLSTEEAVSRIFDRWHSLVTDPEVLAYPTVASSKATNMPPDTPGRSR